MNRGEQEQPQAAVQDGYAVDIRVFLAVITVAMAGSFILGVGLGPVDIPILPLLANAPLTTAARRDAPTTVHHYDVPHNDKKAETTTKQEDVHLPAGQHLLVDMAGVEADFLNSEERLSAAMVETVKSAGLTMLSYHCHSLLPSGVSCVGVLLESHISFHTWPEDGVITLDLFTCGEGPLLPVISTIESLFGIPRDPDTPVRTQWSHELRGFRSDEGGKKNYLDDSSDLSLWVLSPLQMHSKKQIHSSVTKYQRVDIWDLVEVTDTPSYQDILKYNMTPGDARLTSPDYVTPDRLLFLDGIIQSVGMSEAVYHEAMVHPAMFAHAKPERVVIVGGGEGATLREVLKHSTLKQATMIELDRELVEIAQKYLPEMSDCSDLKGRADDCLKDDLVDVVYQDGREWFIQRYGDKAQEQEKLDVILLDALDPEEDTLMSELLYSDQDFITALMNSLNDDGILAIQVGTAATIDDPKPDFGTYKNRELLFNLLESNDQVEAMLVYEEQHCGFLEPHSFLVVCKSASCRTHWYARADQVDYQIYDRIVTTHSKKRALQFYDGTTQRTYQWPKKGWETVYCRREPMPFECNYRHLDFNAQVHELDMDDPEESSFRVEIINDDGSDEETHVYATVDIPKGSYIMPGHLASSLEVTTKNLEGLRNNLNVGGGRVAVIDDLLSYFEDYAHETSAVGSSTNYVEVGGSVLIRRVEDANDPSINLTPWMPPNHPRPKYSPVYERHRISFDVFMVASRDIAKDEELVMHSKMWQS